MLTHTPRSSTPTRPADRAGTAAEQALLLLRSVFTVAPIVFGLDKFANLLTDWPGYLAPFVDRLVPGTAQQAMYAVGVIEIVAGILVAVRPKYGAVVVAAWLGTSLRPDGALVSSGGRVLSVTATGADL